MICSVSGEDETVLANTEIVNVQFEGLVYIRVKVRSRLYLRTL